MKVGLSDSRRKIPAVHFVIKELMNLDSSLTIVESKPIVNAILEKMRSGENPILTASETAGKALEIIKKFQIPRIKKVINATGVLLHTNLGRAPLGKKLFEKIRDQLSGYLSLEYDLNSQGRGNRGVGLERLLCHLSGSEAALVVNNNAAGVLLVLRSLCQNREVIVSRGELVQIGGGFRMPDVLLESGAKLREVGTTNRTVLNDYENAISTETSAILKVHPSNFKQEGFVEEACLDDLAELSKKKSILLIEDLGSGAFYDTRRYGFGHEPSVQESIKAGVDLVCVSGDKLLGGGQAGIILGKTALIAILRKQPMYRALRCGKLELFVLEQVVESVLRGEHENELGLFQLLRESSSSLTKRLERIGKRLGEKISWKIIDDSTIMGGGALPCYSKSDPTLTLHVSDPASFSQLLIQGDPPIIPRIVDDSVRLNFRTVFSDEDEMVFERIEQAIDKIVSSQ